MRNVKVLGFDLDGTLVKMKLDFKQIRKDLSIPEGDTLDYISSLPTRESKKLIALLRDRELLAAKEAEPAEGAHDILDHCRKKEIKVVVITRNSEEATLTTLEKLGMEVDMVVSRDNATPKPSPEAINLVLSQYGIEPSQMVYVGDYLYDLQAGNAAGVKTILIANQEKAGDWAPMANFVAEDLREVLEILKDGRSIGR